MKVLGIDASTKTGLVVLDGDEHAAKLLQIPSVNGFERLQLIASNFDQFLEVHRPDVAFFEEYALGLKKSGDTIITQIAVGTTLRFRLAAHNIPWRMIRPNTMKLWLGGKGFGGMGKPQVAEFVKARWSFANDSDDITDGYALARMGQWLLEAPVEKWPKGVDYGYGPLPEIAI